MTLYTENNWGIAQPLTIEGYKPATMDVLASEWETSKAMNPLQAMRNLNPGQEVEDFSDMTAEEIADYAREERAPNPVMPMEQQEQRIREAGLEGQLKGNEHYSADALEIIIDAKKQENFNRFVYDKASGGDALLGLGAGLMAGMMDPINLASMFVPVPGFGTAKMTQALGRASLGATAAKGALNRAKIRAAEGIAAGAMGAVMLEPMIAAGQDSIQADYTLFNSLMNVSFGAVMGGILKPAGGAIGDWARYRRGQAQPWEYAPQSAETEAVRKSQADAMFNAMRDTEAGADLDALRAHVEDVATVYDAWTRHIAWKEQVPVNAVYDRWKIDYYSGEIFDQRVANARQLLDEANTLQDEIAQLSTRKTEQERITGLPISNSVFGLDRLKAQLAELEPGLPEAQKLIAKDNAIRLAEAAKNGGTLNQPGLARDSLTGGEKLARELNDWERTVDNIAASGALPGKEVRALSQTPLVMQLLDTDPNAVSASAQGGIYVSPHVFDKKHPNIGPKELKQIPRALADPIAIFESATHKGDLVFMTPIKDAYGATIVLPVELKKKQGSRQVGFNRVKSAYAKDYILTLGDMTGAVILPNDKWFIRQLNENARYVNGQKLREWASAAGVQFPIGVRRPAQDSLNAKLSANPDIVNPDNKNARYVNGRKLEDWMRTRGSNSQGRLERVASNSSSYKIFTEADLVNLREQNPTLYQTATDQNSLVPQPAKPQPAQPSRPNAVGGDTTQILGANGMTDPARYEVWELADIIPSHDPKSSFQRRPEYPAQAQERPYHSDVGEQGKVLQNAKEYNHEFVLNSDPTAGNGPPIVTKSGIVLGGNSRAMTLDLVYARHPEKAAAYRQALADKSSHFGLDAEKISAMNQPVLVRVVADMDLETMARKSREYNQTTTQKLQGGAEAISRARFFSDGTLAEIAAGVERNGKLAEYLTKAESAALVNRLVKDGVLLQTEYSSLTDANGLLNQQGRKLVKDALRGLIIADYDTLSRIPANIVAKLDLSVPALTRIRAAGPEWDLSGKITNAMKLIVEARKNKLDMEVWFRQSGVLNHLKDDPLLQVLALTFQNAKAKEIRARMEIFAKKAANSSVGQNALLGGPPPADPKSAFKTAFVRSCASIDNISIEDFRPLNNERHAAIQWAIDNAGGKNATAQKALEKITKKLADDKLTPEQKAQLVQYQGELSRFVGKIYHYDPKLGSLSPPPEPVRPVADAAPSGGPQPQSKAQPEAGKKAEQPAAEQSAAEIPQAAPEPAQKSVIERRIDNFESNRAATTFFGNHEVMVRFFKSADFSSAPHEMYHIIQRQLEELATAENAHPDFRRQWQRACEFVGAEPGQRWTIEQHEKFAKAAERYFWEGKAPNAQLQPVMERMKERFLDVYADAEAAGLQISDGMRQAFDQMLQVPIAEGQRLFQKALAELNQRDWERKFYDPASVIDYSQTPFAKDMATDINAGKTALEAEQQQVQDIINTLNQSGVNEYLQLGRELTDELAQAEAELQKILKRNQLIEELAACQMSKGH